MSWYEWFGGVVYGVKSVNLGGETHKKNLVSVNMAVKYEA